MNKKAMFEFAIEQKKLWKETQDDTYMITWATAKRMIEVAGLWDEWKEYVTKK